MVYGYSYTESISAVQISIGTYWNFFLITENKIYIHILHFKRIETNLNYNIFIYGKFDIYKQLPKKENIAFLIIIIQGKAPYFCK